MYVYVYVCMYNLHIYILHVRDFILNNHPSEYLL